MTINRIIAVKEHIVTERFLSVAHELDFLPAERTEVEIMRGSRKVPIWGPV